MAASGTKAQQLANAFKLVVLADHYAVGIVGDFTDDEYEAARALLLRERGQFSEGTEPNRRLTVAITLLEKAASQRK